jgi:hypothetical protein
MVDGTPDKIWYTPSGGGVPMTAFTLHGRNFTMPDGYADYSGFSIAPISADMGGATSIVGNIAEGAAIGVASADLRIPNQAPQASRLPVSDGYWTDLLMPGESSWLSTKPSVNAITSGAPVPFTNGLPQLQQWSRGSYDFPNLTGNNNHDFGLAYEKIAANQGLPNKTAAKIWLSQQELTLHHNPNGVRLELIPSALHNNVPHAGGATILKNWDYSQGTPWQVFQANRLAQGARYLGIAGTVVGAAVDADSLYSQYQISSRTGNYSNTYNETARVTGGWAGALTFGSSGAQIGAGFGSLLGPIGTVAGGIVGGAIGGAVGYTAGGWAFQGAWNDARSFFH